MDSLFIIPKLSYEILNTSIKSIASSLGLTEAMVQKHADDNDWVQWFPSEATDSISLDIDEQSEEADLLEGEDIFTVRADQFLDKNRKRLQVFSMAKELAMAEHYAGFEASLIDKAKSAVMEIEISDVKALKDLSTVFKDLAKDLQGTTAVSFAQDQGGLPTVIVRDLSGS